MMKETKAYDMMLDKSHIIGLSDNMDSGVCAIGKSARMLYAVNEERLNREKMHTGIPIKSIDIISKTIERMDIQEGRIAGLSVFGQKGLYSLYYKPDMPIKHLSCAIDSVEVVRRAERAIGRIVGRRQRAFGRYLRGIKSLVAVDHHSCHAASAYYTGGFRRALIVTMDGYGDGFASTVSLGEGRRITRIAGHGWGSTIAHLYSRITQYLGFMPHRHEGKITGLAAYGDPSRCMAEMKRLAGLYPDGRIWSASFLRAGFDRKRLHSIFSRYRREDVAASLQLLSEEIVTGFVRAYVRKTESRNVVLAGGVFSNVKINKRIMELDEIDDLYVFPHMGDGGLAAGAALTGLSPIPYRLPHVYLGPQYSEQEIKGALDAAGLEYIRSADIEEEVAHLLSKGMIVARFSGRMEYGPRALGNRSVLADPSNPSITKKLNGLLGRTEFMPFAPSTVAEHADSCYIDSRKASRCARFMTIALNCTERMKRQSPAAIHIDGTARPQIVEKDVNPSYHKIIRKFYEITGNPSVLNTSFNAHEEPIVCTPDDAIRAFVRCRLDYLAIGDFLAKRRNL